MSVNVIPVTDAQGAVANPDMLGAAEEVHRQLRTLLPPDYAGRMKEIFANGAEMAVAVVEGKVAGITVFRVLENTSTGRVIHCDDLVTDQVQRSSGVGHALIEYLEAVGRERNCAVLQLDSGTQRPQAHKFYFREGLPITAFHFTKKL